LRPRIPPRVRDDRDTPLEWDETARISELIWVRREQKYFCKWGWTANSLICPSGKSAPCYCGMKEPMPGRIGIGGRGTDANSGSACG
jgi:hypothetical protein